MDRIPVKDIPYKGSTESPFNKKHETSQISSQEFIDVLEAKLNLHSLMDNSKTIEDILKSPTAQGYLSWSLPKDKSIRNKSPKEVKIDQIPEDSDVYQEITIVKGKAKNNNNFVVNKMFKKKNAVKFILNRRVNETKAATSKNVIPKAKVFKKAIKSPSLLQDFEDHKQKLATRLEILCANSNKGDVEYREMQDSDQFCNIHNLNENFKQNSGRYHVSHMYEEIRIEEKSSYKPNFENSSNFSPENRFITPSRLGENIELNSSLDSESQREVNLSALMQSASSESRNASEEGSSPHPLTPDSFKKDNCKRLINGSDDSLVLMQESDTFI